MVHFEYPSGKPEHYIQKEEKVKNDFKIVFDKYPIDETTFTWDGKKYTFSSTIDMAEFMDVPSK